MGVFDIVPGISGGTIAFILGIYERLISSIHSVQWNLKKIAWGFLTAICGGILTSLIFFAQIITYILNHETYRVCLYAAFLGLILASSIIIGRRIKNWNWRYCIPFLASFVIAFCLTTIKPFKTEKAGYEIFIPKEDIPKYREDIANYDDNQQLLLHVQEEALAAMMARGTIDVDTPVIRQRDGKRAAAGEFIQPKLDVGINFKLVLSGAIAVMAMLLPGISGSYLLVVLGMYPIIIGAIADLALSLRHLSIDTESLMILVSTGIGIFFGAISFAGVINWLFKHYHDATIFALLGFMLGAIPSVWPFHSYTYILLPLKLEKGPQLQVLDSTFPGIFSTLFLMSVCCALVGFSIATGIEWIARHNRPKKEIIPKLER